MLHLACYVISQRAYNRAEQGYKTNVYAAKTTTKNASAGKTLPVSPFYLSQLRQLALI